jgi:hypothetical protein
MRLDAVVGCGVTLAQRRLDPPDFIGPAIERDARKDEDALRAEALGFSRERCRCRLA